MSTTKRKSKEEKITIVAEAKVQGWVETARKHGVSYPTLKAWHLLIETGGESALGNTANISSIDLKRLMLENQRLKEIVAEKELEIRIKNELLKKK